VAEDRKEWRTIENMIMGTSRTSEVVTSQGLLSHETGHYNPLKHSGYSMYRLFEYPKNSTFCVCVCVCFMWFSQ
jgi:hypothetical protein